MTTKTTTTTRNDNIIPNYDLLSASELAGSSGEFTLPAVLRDVVYYKNAEGQERTSIVLSVPKAGSRDPEAQVQANFSYSWNDMTREQVAAWKDAAKVAKGKLKVEVTFELTSYLGGKPQIVYMAKRS